MFGETHTIDSGDTMAKTIVNIVLKSGKEFEIATDGDAKLLYSLVNSLLQNTSNKWIAFPQLDGEPLVQIRSDEIAAVTFFETTE